MEPDAGVLSRCRDTTAHSRAEEPTVLRLRRPCRGCRRREAGLVAGSWWLVFSPLSRRGGTPYRASHDARKPPGPVRGIETEDGWVRSAAAGVRLAAVVRLAAAGAELASLCLCHSGRDRTSRTSIPVGTLGDRHVRALAVADRDRCGIVQSAVGRPARRHNQRTAAAHPFGVRAERYGAAPDHPHQPGGRRRPPGHPDDGASGERDE